MFGFQKKIFNVNFVFGDKKDKTRKCEFYDETYKCLTEKIGIKEL